MIEEIKKKLYSIPVINRLREKVLSLELVKKILKIKQARKTLKRNKELIDKTAFFFNKDLIYLEDDVVIHSYVIIKNFSKVGIIKIGKGSLISHFTIIYSGDHGITIGKEVMIAPHCVIMGGNHNFKQTSTTMKRAEGISKGPIIIEDDVWIGANSVILDGVKLAKGSVIGAGSIVTKDTQPYSISVGNPAKQIGSRKDYK